MVLLLFKELFSAVQSLYWQSGSTHSEHSTRPPVPWKLVANAVPARRLLSGLSAGPLLQEGDRASAATATAVHRIMHDANLLQ
jgi:hypothetical protein